MPNCYAQQRLVQKNLDEMWFCIRIMCTKSNWWQSRCKCTKNVCHLPNGQNWFMTKVQCKLQCTRRIVKTEKRYWEHTHVVDERLSSNYRINCINSTAIYFKWLNKCRCGSLTIRNFCAISNDFQNTYISFSWFSFRWYVYQHAQNFLACDTFQLDGDVMIAHDLVEMKSTHIVAQHRTCGNFVMQLISHSISTDED